LVFFSADGLQPEELASDARPARNWRAFMTEQQAVQTATEFLAAQQAESVREDSRSLKYQYQFLSVEPAIKRETSWSVLFGIRTPEGHPIDGHRIVEVDDATGKVEVVR
jgi:hypothetical protein